MSNINLLYKFVRCWNKTVDNKDGNNPSHCLVSMEIIQKLREIRPSPSTHLDGFELMKYSKFYPDNLEDSPPTKLLLGYVLTYFGRRIILVPDNSQGQSVKFLFETGKEYKFSLGTSLLSRIKNKFYQLKRRY